MNTADLRLLRAARRDALIAAGAVNDARRATRTRVVPSGKTYRRNPKHQGAHRD
jgi:hypothetical protein